MIREQKHHAHSHEEGHSHDHCCADAHDREPHDAASCSCKACTLMEQEEGCSCGHSHDHGEEEGGLRVWLPLGISIALLAVSFLMPFAWLRLTLQALSALISGWKMMLEGLKGLIRFSLDEMTLMSIAVVAAFAIGEGFEGAIVVILFHIGEAFEERAVRKSRDRIDALVNIVPEQVNLLFEDGTTFPAAAADVAPDTRILVRAGERIPLDCIVLDGRGDVDTSAITGEGLPVAVGPGSELLSGMVSQNGVFTCQVVRGLNDSAASKIAQLVRDATKQKGQTERFITRFSRYYTPAVVLLAVLIAVVPSLITGMWSQWIHRSLVFLVASCPCALVLSVPLTFYSVIGTVSRLGGLLKGSQTVETLAKTSCVVFDKTGTLTTGEVAVKEYHGLNGLSDSEFLALCARCESGSVHPVAQAVLRAYGASVAAPDFAEEIPGRGIHAELDHVDYYCGSQGYMELLGVSCAGYPAAQIYLSDGKQLLGYVQMGDTVKPEAKQTLAELRQLGVLQTAMLTGDRAEHAAAVAQPLGLTTVYSELLPEQKVEKLRTLSQNMTTTFVGDGINDGPVLAAADVGVAMGMGSDLAAQAADLVLLSNRLTTLPRAIAVCRKGMAIAKQNIWFILLVKFIVLALGVAGLAPMAAAVFADVGVAVLTVLNATRVVRAAKQSEQ